MCTVVYALAGICVSVALWLTLDTYDVYTFATCAWVTFFLVLSGMCCDAAIVYKVFPRTWKACVHPLVENVWRWRQQTDNRFATRIGVSEEEAQVHRDN